MHHFESFLNAHFTASEKCVCVDGRCKEIKKHLNIYTLHLSLLDAFLFV